MTPKTRFCIYTRILQKQLPECIRNILGFIHGENFLCISETKHDKRREERTKLFLLLEEIVSQTQKLSWV
jgi:hypothetical protein